MGYSISYENGSAVKRKRAERGHNKLLVVILAAAISFAAVRIVGYDQVKKLLIPGDAEVTQTAFHDFVDRIQQGSGVQESITAFCRDIMENASVQP